MIFYVPYAVYERMAARYIAHLGLPASVVNYDAKHHLKPKPQKKANRLNGRRGHRASMPRHGQKPKAGGN